MVGLHGELGIAYCCLLCPKVTKGNAMVVADGQLQDIIFIASFRAFLHNLYDTHMLRTDLHRT